MNHEVIQAWWEEHEEIDELMTSIGSALGRKAFSAAYVLLGRLSATLERHFDTEESLYFPFVEQSSPGSGPLLERARSAHRKLRASLEDLHVLVESADAGSAQDWKSVV